jgi:hypothetical protein
MNSFESIRQRKITLRDKEYTVFDVINDQRRDRRNNGLVNLPVKIDGQIYRVIAVESFAIAYIREGMEISLAVEKIDES